MKTFKEWLEARKYGSVLVGKYDTDDELERAGFSFDRGEDASKDPGDKDEDLGDEKRQR